MTGVSNKQIWRGLVDYANECDLESNAALKQFANTLSDSMHWMARTSSDIHEVAEMIATLANPESLFGEVDGKRRWMCFRNEEELAKS